MTLKGPLLLLITAALWGMAFAAQTHAAEHVEAFTFNTSRNIIGALFLTGIIAWRKHTDADKAPHTSSTREATTNTYSQPTLWIAGIACGIALFAASYLQQWGITTYPPEAGASSRSGFVTATYMVMVALMGIALGKRPHPLVFLSVAIALAGIYLLCVPDGLGSIYLGDWLVLASAFGYALHIIIIDRYTHIDGVRLSRIQLIVSATLSLPCALIFENPHPSLIIASLIPILYAGICSDGIAYTLQIIGQQSTPPTLASIIMSLEAVFAALGGWLILNEHLSPTELIGCALVFAAVLLAQTPEFTRTNT